MSSLSSLWFYICATNRPSGMPTHNLNVVVIRKTIPTRCIYQSSSPQRQKNSTSSLLLNTTHSSSKSICFASGFKINSWHHRRKKLNQKRERNRFDSESLGDARQRQTTLTVRLRQWPPATWWWMVLTRIVCHDNNFCTIFFVLSLSVGFFFNCFWCVLGELVNIYWK